MKVFDVTLVLGADAASAQSIRFGNDRNFCGPVMAPGLDEDDTGNDEADCKHGVETGQLTLWNLTSTQRYPM